jgi:hypothetical protein
MSSEQKRILKMVADGKISASDGKELIQALEKKRRSPWKLLIHPFDRLSGNLGLLVSLAAAVIGVFIATNFGVRFDGVLDVHVSTQSVPITVAVLDQVVGWGLLAILFWLTSLLLARQGRLVDFVVIVGVARLPLVLLGALASAAFPDPSAMVRMVFRDPLHPMLWISALVALAFVGWFIALLYNGFKVASGLAGGRLVGSFIWVVVVAEIGSKIVLFGPLFWSMIAEPHPEGPATRFELPGDSYQARAEAFLNLLENGEFDKAWRTFDSRMAEGLSRTKLEWIWRITGWKRGGLRSVDERRTQALDESHIVDLICTFEEEQGAIRLVFDSAGRVSGLWLLRVDQALPAEYGTEQ